MRGCTVLLFLLTAIAYLVYIEQTQCNSLLVMIFQNTQKIHTLSQTTKLQTFNRSLQQQPSNLPYHSLSDQSNDNSDDNSDDSPDSNSNSNKASVSVNNSTFLLIVVICSVAVSVIGIICCVAVIIKCIIVMQQRANTQGKVSNTTKFNYAELCPQIQVGVFYQFVGKPLQDNCVICLEEFQKVESHRHSPSFNKIDSSENKQQNQEQIQDQEKMESKIQEPPRSNQYIQHAPSQIIMIKMTVCGHALHSKCLDSWLQKEVNCPLCRESFSEDNIKEWEKKLGLSIIKGKSSEILATEPQNPNHSRVIMRNSRFHQEQTLNTIPSRRDKQLGYQSNSPQKSKIERELSQQNKKIVKFYRKIMAFHKKQQTEIASKRDWRTPKGIVDINDGLYFMDQGQNINYIGNLDRVNTGNIDIMRLESSMDENVENN